ncbi:MAG: RNA pseudouridine synthase, partial [Gammaproteobacteria bacterium]|nr:RNA pseudouridine synthase [Gammaproteobacteria bacterium]
MHTIKNECGLSSGQIKIAIGKGCLWLESGSKIKRLRRIKTTLKTGEQLHFYYNQQVLDQQPLTAKLIEDNHAYSVWHKPAGMLCQGSKWGDHTTINRYVEKHFQRTAFIVHRLDKMTSGLIIIAHQKKVATAFATIFEQRKIMKEYRALVHGIFEEKTELTIETPVNKKPAISHIQLIT